MPGLVAETADPPIPNQPNFADLYEVNARRDQVVIVMGVVVDFMPPSRSRGPDMQSSFTLQDPISWIDDSDIDPSIGGLKVKFFRPDIKSLPRVQTVGDVVLLRGITIKEYRGNTTALSNRGTKWTVFAGRTIPRAGVNEKPDTPSPLAQWASNGAPRASDAEEVYAIWLRQWSLSKEFLRSKIAAAEAVPLKADPTSSPSVSETGTSLSAVAAPPVRNRSISLSEASDGRFCDVVAEIVKVFETGMGKEVYITDYTENSKFFNYPYPDHDKGSNTDETYMFGDEHGYLGAASANQGAHRDWPGPWGQHVLCVMLFHPHSSAEIKEHDFVSIRNLRCVNSKTGTHLEGKLHSDRHRPDQIDISKINSNRGGSGQHDNQITALRERKEEYWQRHLKRLPNALHGGPLNNKITKAQKKRETKRKRDELKRQNQNRAVIDANKPLKGQGLKSNPRVKCSHPDKSTVLLADMLDNDNRIYNTPSGADVTLPFVNMMCRSRVRVVDFFPPTIEDFARLVPVTEQDGMDDDEPMSPISDRWEWAFYLLVEDAQTPPNGEPLDRVKLLVASDAADFLLKLDASDLRKNKSTLNKLKFRLWTLWGDLAEHKAKHQPSEPFPRASNLPFECCIQEFGIPGDVDDADQQRWTAAHRLVQTTISADDDD